MGAVGVLWLWHVQLRQPQAPGAAPESASVHAFLAFAPEYVLQHRRDSYTLVF